MEIDLIYISLYSVGTTTASVWMAWWRLVGLGYCVALCYIPLHCVALHCIALPSPILPLFIFGDPGSAVFPFFPDSIHFYF
jgi:hypothetical protein